jgi:hypothetical protein
VANSRRTRVARTAGGTIAPDAEPGFASSGMSQYSRYVAKHKPLNMSYKPTRRSKRQRPADQLLFEAEAHLRLTNARLLMAISDDRREELLRDQRAAMSRVGRLKKQLESS